MSELNFPEQTITLIPGTNILSTAPTKVLYVGQKLPAGSAVSGVLVESIGNGKEEDGLFGTDSMIAAMVRAGRLENPITRFDAIPLDDNGSTTASSTIVFGGTTSSADATVNVIVGSTRNHNFKVTIPSGTAVAAIAAIIDSIIDADPKVPVVATNATVTLTLTAKNAGTVGNDIGIRFVGTIPGITVTTTAMTGGATDPVLTNLFDVITNERYQTIVWPQNYDLATVKTLLDGRFNIDKRILDGVAVIGKFDTFSNINALVSAENSQSLNFVTQEIVDENLYRGGSVLELPYVIGAYAAATRALRITPSANIANLVTSISARDRVGGVRLNSLPYANTPLQFLPTMEVGRGFSDSEIATLTVSGASVIGNNIAKAGIIMGEMVTTYKTDSAGNPDTTFKNLNFVDTTVASREIFFNNNDVRFSQARLTEGTPTSGVDNVDTIRAFNNGIYSILSNDDNLLTQAGSQAQEFFNDNLTVALEKSGSVPTGKILITMKIPIIIQLRAINTVIEVAFSIN